MLYIDPIAFTLGPLTIRWYGILIASAILIGTMLALREAERQGFNPDHFFNVILVGVPAAIIGARLYYVIFNWDYYLINPQEIFATWLGGLAIHGGLIGGFLAGYFLLRKYGFPFWKTADIVAPSIILGQAIGRWGNFFNQEAYGYEVDPEKIPWAMYIDGAYRHPAFLYESIWNILVFGFLLWIRRRNFIKTGDVFLLYLILYSVGRFMIEGIRTDSLMLTPTIRAAQALSVVVIILGSGILYYRHRLSGSKAEE